MKKLKTILLVDDCEATNLIHRLIIEKYGCVEEVVETLNGAEAMAFLKTKRNGAYPQPELVFLDVNMPVMNGWEFLDAYRELPESQLAGVVVVMLTTSTNPDDRTRAQELNEISLFASKPLSIDTIDKVLAQHYPDSLREDYPAR
ncbi:response regulator [Spongiibacter sp. KMU-166]|uniref:Response regulator n=1 Tax=Spongiibacter thalassae TaxID=2721624 RepID=A0ABX1GFL0_9GAMM|nr:response regulator [Spongiibacter thalassae]NKI17730.1 response regulator [Spongiibacter thalassae]